MYVVNDRTGHYRWRAMELTIVFSGNSGQSVAVVASANATAKRVIETLEITERFGIDNSSGSYVLASLRLGRVLANDEVLGQSGVRDGDILVLQRRMT